MIARDGAALARAGRGGSQRRRRSPRSSKWTASSSSNSPSTTPPAKHSPTCSPARLPPRRPPPLQGRRALPPGRHQLRAQQRAGLRRRRALPAARPLRLRHGAPRRRPRARRRPRPHPAHPRLARARRPGRGPHPRRPRPRWHAHLPGRPRPTRFLVRRLRTPARTDGGSGLKPSTTSRIALPPGRWTPTSCSGARCSACCRSPCSTCRTRSASSKAAPWSTQPARCALPSTSRSAGHGHEPLRLGLRRRRRAPHRARPRPTPSPPWRALRNAGAPTLAIPPQLLRGPCRPLLPRPTRPSTRLAARHCSTTRTRRRIPPRLYRDLPEPLLFRDRRARPRLRRLRRRQCRRPHGRPGPPLRPSMVRSPSPDMPA